MPQPLALVIEDQRELAEIYSETLRISGFETHIISDGQEALDRIEQIEPDLVLLDINLPRVAGTYILKHIRATPSLASVPVIIATANSVVASTLAPSLSDHDYVLIKPISMGQLNQLAQRLLS